MASVRCRSQTGPVMNYKTPPEIVSVLARHVPRGVQTVLDPAAGTGALLAPLARRFANSGTRVICVDTDGDALRVLQDNFQPTLGLSLRVIHRDFLTPQSGLDSGAEPSFDCVIMNPPFCARKESFR